MRKIFSYINLSYPQVFRSRSFYAVPRRGVGHTATRQCNNILLADEHTLLPDEYAFPEVDEPIGNQGNESGKDSDEDDEDEVDQNPGLDIDLQLLDDTAILDVTALGSL